MKTSTKKKKTNIKVNRENVIVLFLRIRDNTACQQRSSLDNRKTHSSSHFDRFYIYIFFFIVNLLQSSCRVMCVSYIRFVIITITEYVKVPTIDQCVRTYVVVLLYCVCVCVCVCRTPVTQLRRQSPGR